MKLIASVLLAFGFAFSSSTFAQEEVKPATPEKPALEFQIGAGPTIRTGPQPKNGANMEIAAGVFPGRSYWGGALTLYGDFKGSDESFGFLGLGLAYRNEMGERWKWMYDVGPALGMNFVSDGTKVYSIYGEREGQSIGTFFSILHRLQFNYLFSKGTLGASQSEYGIGLGIIHTYVPEGNVHGMNFSGNILGFSLHLTLGL